jgi:hypothetical protein
MSHCRKCENDPFKNFCRKEVRMLIKMLIWGPKIAVLRRTVWGRGNESIEKKAHVSVTAGNKMRKWLDKNAHFGATNSCFKNNCVGKGE